MGHADLDFRPVGPDGLADLATLFEGSRNTRRCWCAASCSTRAQFMAGWLTGGNRRRFEALAAHGGAPMGLLASVSGEPVGWCACGPRARYVVAEGHRGGLLEHRDHDEDEMVWLVSCLFVGPRHRGQGFTAQLVRAAVELARREGAVAIEGWPTAGTGARAADSFLGRQQAFEDLGFRCVGRPVPNRVLMRLELGQVQ